MKNSLPTMSAIYRNRENFLAFMGGLRDIELTKVNRGHNAG